MDRSATATVVLAVAVVLAELGRVVARRVAVVVRGWHTQSEMVRPHVDTIFRPIRVAVRASLSLCSYRRSVKLHT